MRSDSELVFIIIIFFLPYKQLLRDKSSSWAGELLSVNAEVSEQIDASVFRVKKLHCFTNQPANQQSKAQNPDY
jgi:hypothetical protein